MHPWDQLSGFAGLAHSAEEKPRDSVSKVSPSPCDYWQSILIYINDSAILTILLTVLISDILSIMFKYLTFHCAFNTQGRYFPRMRKVLDLKA